MVAHSQVTIVLGRAVCLQFSFELRSRSSILTPPPPPPPPSHLKPPISYVSQRRTPDLKISAELSVNSPGDTQMPKHR